MQPYDEPEIEESDGIIRRIDPKQHVVWDGNRGCNRLSTKLYSPSSGYNGGMSIDIERKIVESDVEVREFVTTPKFTGSVRFLAGEIRKIKLRLGYDPLPDNPHHGEVWGNDDRPNYFSKGQKNALARTAEWFVELEDVELA